jgi:hypothetical protein
VIRVALVNQGRPSKGDNVTFSTDERGNNPTYTLRRLKRDNPELADRVVRGELSANATLQCLFLH